MQTLNSRDPWRPSHPKDVRSWLARVDRAWWIAGGWALDLFLGAEGRSHGDLDVGIFRDDALAIVASLHKWEIFEAKNGVLDRLRVGAAPRSDVNSLWCRPLGAEEWVLELLLESRTAQNWIFRRRPEIARPIASMLERSADGLFYLAPEIQLLYKAKVRRPQDEYDFGRVLPRLRKDAAVWLGHALRVTHPEHPWIARIESTLTLLDT